MLRQANSRAPTLVAQVALAALALILPAQVALALTLLAPVVAQPRTLAGHQAAVDLHRTRLVLADLDPPLKQQAPDPARIRLAHQLLVRAAQDRRSPLAQAVQAGQRRLLAMAARVPPCDWQGRPVLRNVIMGKGLLCSVFGPLFCHTVRAAGEGSWLSCGRHHAMHSFTHPSPRPRRPGQRCPGLCCSPQAR